MNRRRRSSKRVRSRKAPKKYAQERTFHGWGEEGYEVDTGGIEDIEPSEENVILTKLARDAYRDRFDARGDRQCDGLMLTVMHGERSDRNFKIRRELDRRARGLKWTHAGRPVVAFIRGDMVAMGCRDVDHPWKIAILTCFSISGEGHVSHADLLDETMRMARGESSSPVLQSAAKRIASKQRTQFSAWSHDQKPEEG